MRAGLLTTSTTAGRNLAEVMVRLAIAPAATDRAAVDMDRADSLAASSDSAGRTQAEPAVVVAAELVRVWRVGLA